jgi:hypothetical protein
MKINRIVLFLLLLSPCLIGQAITVISGHVSDKYGEPIIGANVLIAGSYDGTSTDIQGNYVFTTELAGSHTLKCSYLGYQTIDFPILINKDTIHSNIIMKLSAVAMREVVITAGTFEAGGENKREILKPLDIVTTAGATADLSGALNTLPGTVTVGESGRLFVRGGEGYETKTFIDGMQVLSFYGPSAPNTPGRSRFLPFMFRGVSFSTGGYSAEYGQALSSALILNSKPVATLERLDISLLSVGGDLSFTETWENASLSGKLQYTDIDPYFSLIQQGLDWVDPPTSIEGMLAYRKKLGNDGIIKLYGNINRSSFILNQEDLLYPETKVRTKIKNQYNYLNGTFSKALKDAWDFYAGVSFTNSRDKITLDKDLVDELDWGLHTKIRFSKNVMDNLKLHFGAEHYTRNFSQDFVSFGNDFRNHFDFKENLTATFIETDIQFTNAILGRIGIRSEYRARTNSMQIAPRVSIGIKTGENSQLGAAFGKFQQQPQGQLLMVANDLQNERATHYILNYQVSGKGQTFRIETYHKKYSHLVKFDPEQISSPQGYDNQGEGFARGFDLFWRDSRSISQVDYWVSYSFLDTERNYLDYPQSAIPSFASKHNLSIVYKQFITTLKSQLGWTFTYASGRPYENPNSEGFLTDRTKSYQDLSLNVSYLFKQNIIIHASATNVFGRDHVFGFTYSDLPDEEGFYAGRPTKAPAKRFLFLGVFITFSKQQILNQLPNL